MAQEAFGYLASKCYAAGLKLFRLRPKIHFQHHLVLQMSVGRYGFSVLRPLAVLFSKYLVSRGVVLAWHVPEITAAGLTKTTWVELPEYHDPAILQPVL